jgi:hypothetical protein
VSHNEYNIGVVILTCTVVVCIKHGKQRADGEDIVVLVEKHLDILYRVNSQYWTFGCTEKKNDKKTDQKPALYVCMDDSKA